MVLNDDVGIAK